jgi:hypothetical protein
VTADGKRINARPKRGLASRVGRWLRSVIRKERAGDAQWEEETRRELTGQMGENIDVGDRSAQR